MKNTESPALEPLESVSKERVVADGLRLLRAFQELSAKERQEVIEDVERRRMA